MIETKAWQCVGCERGPCNLFTDKKATTVCFKCDYDPDNCYWKKSTKYQITEVPEPVYYLDIPPEFEGVIKYSIFQQNGGLVKITENIGEFSLVFFIDQDGNINQSGIGGAFPVMTSWIKQKQPEPTREELQERINKMVAHADKSMGVGQAAYDKIKALSRGEKP